MSKKNAPRCECGHTSDEHVGACTAHKFARLSYGYLSDNGRCSCPEFSEEELSEGRKSLHFGE